MLFLMGPLILKLPSVITLSLPAPSKAGMSIIPRHLCNEVEISWKVGHPERVVLPGAAGALLMRR